MAWLRNHIRQNLIDTMRLGDAALASPYAVSNWLRKGADPSVASFEAVLNTLGFRIEIVPVEKDEI